jgi:hypothetical protein
MSKKLFMVLGLSLLLLTLAVPASAIVTLSLYESADGINPPGIGNPATERPPAILLSENVVDGVVRVWENPAQTVISDFVWFFEDVGKQYVQLFSDPFTTDEINRFLAITPFADIVETAPPTVYIATGNTYYIYSDAPEVVPVPPSLVLLGSGLLGFITMRRFQS